MNPLMKNADTWERTGNIAVDMVANAVYRSRQTMKPLRSIHLRPEAFKKFLEFVLRKAGEENVLGKNGEVIAPLDFDGVAIKKGSALQADHMAFDFWPLINKDVESYKEYKAINGEFPEHLTQVK
jgi:hypothetical protein